MKGLLACVGTIRVLYLGQMSTLIYLGTATKGFVYIGKGTVTKGLVFSPCLHIFSLCNLDSTTVEFVYVGAIKALEQKD